jgi:hypothetical protein
VLLRDISDPSTNSFVQVESQTIPRTPAGVVSETGGILDDAGRNVGKITESEDGRSLVGNTVTATGDVVDKTTGDVLGRASLESEESAKNQEYTTGQGQEDVQSQKSGSGIFGTIRSGVGYVGSLGGGSKKSDASIDVPASEAPKAKDLDADQAQSTVKDTAEGLDTEKVQDTAKDAASEAPVDSSVAQDTSDELKDGLSQVDDARSQAAGSEVPSQGAPISLDDREGAAGDDEAGKDDEDDKKTEVPESVAGKSNLDLTEKAGSQADLDLPEKEGVESQVGVDETKSQANLDDIPEKAKEATGSEAPLEEQPSADGAKTAVEDAKAEGTEAVEGAVPAEGEAPAEEQKEEEAEDESSKLDYSFLKGAKVNKIGNLVNDNGDVVGHVVEGEPKKLQGKRSDGEGNIWNDAGEIVGKAEPLSEGEREDKKKSFAPFENFPDAIVEADGRVLSEGRQVGTVVEGDPKRLKGSKVDEDGDILDRNGNTVGRAEAWDEPEPIPEEPEEIPDRSILAGKRVNKAGNVVDSAGTIFGKVVEGNVASIVGRMSDKDGNIRSESGDVVGRAEVVPEGEREGSKEGPFAELSGLTVRKDGMVVTPSDEVVGRLTSGDPKKLFGRSVDEDGDVVDKNGNVLGKAERYEEPEEVVEEKKKGPLFGRKVNKEGNVTDEDGNVIAKLVSGDLLVCSGKEIDDDGDVINSKGNTVGHVALLEDIPEPEPEEEVETEEQRKEREQAEADRKLAGQLSGAIEQSLEKIKPLCKLITDKIDKAERTPKEELDEEQLVREVKPLIEEGGKILSETNGIVRGLDPDGRIQRQAKQRSGTRDASPEEYHLAEVLKEVSSSPLLIPITTRLVANTPHSSLATSPRLSTTPSVRSRACLMPRRSSTPSGVSSWSPSARFLPPSDSSSLVSSALLAGSSAVLASAASSTAFLAVWA